jgi:hypothetical protein
MELRNFVNETVPVHRATPARGPPVNSGHPPQDLIHPTPTPSLDVAYGATPAPGPPVHSGRPSQDLRHESHPSPIHLGQPPFFSKSPPYPTRVSSDPPKPLVDSGLPKPNVDSGPPEPIVASGPPPPWTGRQTRPPVWPLMEIPLSVWGSSHIDPTPIKTPPPPNTNNHPKPPLTNQPLKPPPDSDSATSNSDSDEFDSDPEEADIRGAQIVGPYVPVEVANQYMPALFDTGCDISLISRRFYDGLTRKPTLKPCRTLLTTISGETTSADGVVILTVTLGKTRLKHKFTVGTYTPDIIIGLDFMNKHHCYYIPHLKCVKHQQEHIDCMPKESHGWMEHPKACRASVVNNTVLKGGQEKMVKVRIEPPPNRPEWTPEGGMLTGAPPHMALRGVVLPRVLTGERLEYEVPVMNVTDSTRKLHKGQTISTWEEVEVLPGQEAQPPVPTPLPDYLENLVKESDLTSKSDKEKLTDLLRKYQKVFAGPNDPLGLTNLVEHRIDTGDARPIKQPYCRTDNTSQGIITHETYDMMGQELVENSDSPWASPVVLVKKKNGEVRFCIDYRRLNSVTRKDSYPLPRIEESLEALGGALWFITLDLKSGYWQVPVRKEDREKTAFITRDGLFQFKVLPFGLTCAPATFERLMDKLLRGAVWKKCLVYLDDIIVFGNSFEQALGNFEEVLQRLQSANLKLKPSKCHLFRKSVDFLGHIVSSEGIQTDPTKIEKVEFWEPPINLHEVRSFLGLAGYYRRFVPDYSTVAEPLTRLTRKNVPFDWNPPQQEAFECLKTALTTAPILGFPRDAGRFILDTDASGTGIGAVLSQEQDGEERVIAYASHTLSRSQQNYCTTKRELLAVVVFIQQYQHFLADREFTLRTDHASLTWLTNFNVNKTIGIIARWIVILQQYNFITQHRAGRLHGNADALSRRYKRCPTTMTDCPTCYPLETPTPEPDDEFMHAHARRAQELGVSPSKCPTTIADCSHRNILWKVPPQNPTKTPCMRPPVGPGRWGVARPNSPRVS